VREREKKRDVGREKEKEKEPEQRETSRRGGRANTQPVAAGLMALEISVLLLQLLPLRGVICLH
jgi:hypothetical protein